jgi:hypothetical protein
VTSGELARGALCLDGCDRIDIHAGGTCERDGQPLVPGPLDIMHRHPDIPVFTPIRNEGVLIYDMVLPKWPGPEGVPWTPMRNAFARWHSGKICYTLPSGNIVHVKPDCRC